MGSVPNCRKEIADRYPIRWFKCKLKPPKNQTGSAVLGRPDKDPVRTKQVSISESG